MWPRGAREVARIIYLFAAEKSLLHDAAQDFSIVRCDFVAVVEGGGGDGELGDRGSR